MRLTLCYAPIACSLVPLINLNGVGGSFEVRKINLRKGDNMTLDHLAMNPLHKVPVLIVGGRALTENVAINTYIARTYPAAKLLPSNSMDERRCAPQSPASMRQREKGARARREANDYLSFPR